MAHRKSTENYIRLTSAVQWTDGTDGVFASVDLSAFVDPLHSLAFKIVRAGITISSDSAPYGLMNSGQVIAPSIGMQIATGAQTTILKPSDGKIVYHKFGLYVNDADGAPYTWNWDTWHVDDLWPGGYVAVIDNLTASAQSEADFGANFRMCYTITGYQTKVSANQLASLLVAQTQS